MLDVVLSCCLFEKVPKDRLPYLLKCLEAKKKSYKKDEVIFAVGDNVDKVGIVLNGMVQVVRDDLYGNRTITASLSKSDIFGEVFACLKTKSLPISVVCAEESDILFVDFFKSLKSCVDVMDLESILLGNMLNTLAQKNYFLTEKLEIVTARNIRDKIWTYFLTQKQAAKSNNFTIPFDRQGLADFLSVNRSALSRELSSMKDEGLIDFEKNKFKIVKSL